ncbi:hypothetical protein JR316_0002314 [Psilocybe cubensis]|uniref:Uncharacterized protein n=2 Tax=Psilocybe cubensis TaxID=181762 RepID=A0A8H7Y5I4_PSICU|nr:hypothetical protein JR316_0002314 [Psilocybe cubensis]KAH9485406.1 hypothetical protein JR316_0002314 [Psilocybe cubensis]
MAATLHPSRNDAGASSLYPRVIMNEYDYGDNRYPTISSQTKPSQPTVSVPLSTERPWDVPSNVNAGEQQRENIEYAAANSLSGGASVTEQRRQAESQSYVQRPSSRQEGFPPETTILPTEPFQDPPRSSLSYALPSGAARRVIERYSLDDNDRRPQSKGTSETRPSAPDATSDTVLGRNQPILQEQQKNVSPQGRISPNPSSTNRKTSSPGQNPSNQFPPIMPLSASPTYVPPLAPNHRASAQQPIYVNQPNAPDPMQTVYTPIIPPQDEICVECAMRDQDMADVDVTSPGVWERASDVVFEELKARELEDEANGVIVEDSTRPRIKGGRLTEQNVKLWLSINPREPASRQQTLNTYVKSQRKLLEAEAVAHARAMQEAKQLDNRMRDAYSQLRRSAYDMGSSPSHADDAGGVRIKPPVLTNAASQPQSHGRSHSREITLLENGMIVEHVDVRKEEKEARDRKKREEKRARKSSRGSMMDVTSVISGQSNGPLAGESSLKPYSRYSNSSSTRPTSVLTTPHDRPDLPRAYSTASFSDVHSLGSASPRRTRFFGMKNLSAGWKSQDSLAPSGISGSMVDMHVALHREAQRPGSRTLISPPIDLNTPRRSKIWMPTDYDDANGSQILQDDRVKKKKGGLAKIWRIVTGKNDGFQQATPGTKNEGQEDDLPLAPPPPLSYLVDRGPPDLHTGGGMRHSSTPSLPSVVSPKFGSPPPGMSPPTAPSSLLPSPVSLRTFGADIEVVDGRIGNDPEYTEQKFSTDDAPNKTANVAQKSIHSTTSDMELRRTLSGPSFPPTTSTPSNGQNSSIRPASVLSRDKSLPPLPPNEQPARILPSDLRPRTLYTYDPRTLPPGTKPPHDFLPPQAPFRTGDGRRQSFGGTSSRPNLQTMPVSRPVDFDSSQTLGSRYDEFGFSQRSLGRLDHVTDQLRKTSPPASTKRKSRFGLSSLLGKKQDKREPNVVPENIHHEFPSMGHSSYDNPDELNNTGYATSTSRHSTFSSGPTNPNMRMSVTSRKALEDLVQQDAEFVAYRYPSNDQRLDLLR